MPNLYSPGGLARDPLYFYHLSDRLGVVVLSINKNACTAQKRWLLTVEGIPLQGDVHRLAFTRLSLLNRPGEARAHALSARPLVIFLRDPLLRLVSAFTDKLVNPLNFAGATIIEGVAARRGLPLIRDGRVPFPSMEPDALFAACSGVDYSRGVSFREFVEYVAGAPDLELDPHFRPQAWFLGPALQRAGATSAPPTLLAPMHLVSQILGELGSSLGLPAPSAQHPGSDDLSAPQADLSDTPSGELQALPRRPRASELCTDDLIDLIRRRYGPDEELWRSLGLTSAAETLRHPRTPAAA